MGQESFGQVLRRLRRDRGWTQYDLELRAGIDRTSIGRYERGGNCPPATARVLDRVLDARGELALAAGVLPDRERAGTVGTGPSRVMLRKPGGQPEEVGQTERRTLMNVAAGLAAGSVVGPHTLTEARQLGSVSPEWLASIEHETQTIAYQVWRVPDQRALFSPAMEQYVTITSLLKQPQRTADRRRLMRAGANISGAIGDMYGEAGDLRTKISWLRSSHSAALDAGDPYLADMALVSMAHSHMFGGQPAEALAVIAPRLDRPIARPNQGTAKLHGAAARAHAQLGDRAASRRHLDAEREAFNRAPDPGIHAWEFIIAAQIDYHAAAAAASLGETTTVIEAADRAIGGLDPADSCDRFLILFDKATALYRLGDVGEACRLAIQAVGDPEMLVNGTSARVRIAAFDNMLGRATSGPVAEWRDAYQARKADELTI